MNPFSAAADHEARTRRMLAETFGLLSLCMAAAGWAVTAHPALAVVPSVLVGVWMQRLYVVGHEAAHRKLFPSDRKRNDRWGQLALLPILVPLPVFVAIHRFHHGQNRRDAHTSALDTFVFDKVGVVQRAWAWLVWLLAVLGGGWFWHSVVSILLFLFLPVRVARRISPAFKGWTLADRVRSVMVFAVAVAAHVAVALFAGLDVWLATLGGPLLVFGWVYSVQLYVYHYDTTMGPRVAMHARRLNGPGVAWWLLNLNEHDTHHRYPKRVWYALPGGPPLPAEHAANQQHSSFFRGVLDQLKGPRILDADTARDPH